MLLSPTKFWSVKKEFFFPPILKPVPQPVPIPIPVPIPRPYPPRCIISRRSVIVKNSFVEYLQHVEYNPYIGVGVTILLYILLMLYVNNSQKSNIGKFLNNVGKSYDPEMSNTTFKNIAGIENAKEDLLEIIDFLNNKESYVKMGARIPKGVLLVGPPGTGKTLLSRAVAGEANVPFFSCSGSEFIELYVGTGAARIRELFKKAKEKTPCIIFIDEIDAIGKRRSSGLNVSNDERDQTLNQLLTEMDGFEENKGIILMAATNRAELLDDALLRPGRFDRKINVDLPNIAARAEILKLYLDNKPTTNIDVPKLAKMTMGFSGAELENLCNETAIYAARNKKEIISQDMFEQIFDKLTLGPESKNNVMTQTKQKILAYHEAGHVLAGILVGDFDTFRKVSIAPRGDAGGITFFEPSEERLDIGLYSREYLLNQLVVLLAGRAAEEITFGTTQITTGASNDIERATHLAHQMVSKFGFNETIGPVHTDATTLFDKDVASEIRHLVEHAYHKACDLLRTNEGTLIQLAKLLIEKETLDSNDVLTIMSGMNCNIYKQLHFA
jgi:cell division protease FtsH